MRGKSLGEIVGWVLLGILCIGGLAILFGFIMMWLWNCLMPKKCGLTELTFWQAVDLFILSNIFIGTSSSGGKIVNQKSVVTTQTQKNILIEPK